MPKQKPMNLAFINRILNVGTNEWPRIVLGWCLHLFLRIGFVMGWTVTIALFINRIGIERLPYLFVLNALLVMLGTILFSYLLKKIKRAPLILYTTLLAGALLLLATMFAYSSNIAFIGLILLAQSILLSQLNILIALFTEDLFSPLESQRTFPLIASSETIGGIIGGLMIGVLSGFLPAYKFVYLWIIAILFIVPTILTSHQYSKQIPSIKISKTPKQKEHRKSAVPNTLKGIQNIKKVPFLRGIVVIIVLQFMLLNLFEFQYTKAIQEEVVQHHNQAMTFEFRDYQPNTNLQVSLLDVTAIAPGQQSAQSLQLENELFQKLGMLQVIFFTGSLFVQMLAASRIISSLGIVSSLLLHPLVTLLNLVWMTFNFGFLSAAIGRSNFEITGGIFRNAYHSSYYAIAESKRDQVKEVLEGFVKPFGAILAFALFFLISRYHPANTETLAITLAMVGIAALMSLRLLRLQKNYTDLSHKNLSPNNDLPTRLNAIEILGQKGHEFDTGILVSYLKKKREDKHIKLKILEILKLIQDPRTLTNILDCTKDNDADIRLSAIETLTRFNGLKKALSKKAFTRYRTVETIKTLFKVEESSKIRVACIQLLAKIDQGDLIPFIVSAMTQGDEKIKRACIRACGSFKDSNITHYVETYLNHKDIHVRAETIAALWQFGKVRKTLTHYLDQMKKGRKKETILATLFTLGEIRSEEDLPYLIQHLASHDHDIREAAAHAMCKLNHPAAIPHIAEFLMHEDHELAHKTKKFVRNLTLPIVDSIEKLVHVRISQYIHDLLNESNAKNLMEVDLETLEKLKTAYATVDKYDEVFKIEKIIHEKETSSSLNQKAYVMAS